MHTENTVFIRGPQRRIFELAAATENWPTLLPHYRGVRVLDRTPDGRRRVVEMTAVRDDFPVPGIPFPVRWRSVQVTEPEHGKIFFKHLAGVAIGMWVVWTLEPDRWGRGVRVSIRHDLSYPFDVLNGWFAHDLVGRQFVQAIAGRTLATIKHKVESEQG